MKTLLIGGVALAAAALLVSQPAPREQVGPLPDGSFLLNNGWRVKAAGTQVPVDTFPMSSVVSKDGKYLLVLNGGYNPPSVSVIEVAGTRELSRTPVPDGWLGLAFAPKGDIFYVGGGSKGAVYEFGFAEGRVQAMRTINLFPDGQRTAKDFIGDVKVSPDGTTILATNLYRDAVLSIDRVTGKLQQTFKTGRRPYRLLFYPDGKSFFASSWSDGTVTRYRTTDGSSISSIRVGPHSTDLLMVPGDPNRLFVTAANTNNTYVIGVPNDEQMTHVETLNLGLWPLQPVGMTPSALGVSTDNKTIYVVCSDANAVAVIDISGEHSVVRGFIPAGWYPTAVNGLPDGRIAILNGRGLRSFPNPHGPNPTKGVERSHEGVRSDEYVGKIQRGTVSFVNAPTDQAMGGYTDAVRSASAYNDTKLEQKSTLPAGIQHVIYIVKENRSYDQVLGDDARGQGEPSLVLFGEKITPNLHKIAREFVLLDNFYVNADVSADGHNWSTAAIAPDYVQKLWPNSYALRRKTYDYEGGESAALPPAGYLWNNGKAAGLTMRNYGYFVNNKPLAQVGADGGQIASVRDPVLANITNARYRGFDLDYPDVSRAKVFLSDLADFEKTGNMPGLMFVRMGNDHTSGIVPGKVAPLSAVADNDYGVGMLVEGVSRSRFWAQTAIFILEDDAQTGPDHIDSHRSPAFLISPYVRHGVVDSSFYNTTSMLRTMELILGLHPMTVFDAGARVMSAAFTATPDNRPYTAVPPNIPLDTTNPPNSTLPKVDLDAEDRVDEGVMNRMLWSSIRGTQPMPAPVRSIASR
jgi:DNA-binding beta-propeller fold protein YncE